MGKLMMIIGFGVTAGLIIIIGAIGPVSPSVEIIQAFGAAVGLIMGLIGFFLWFSKI